jgi:hypothetical protein
MLSKVFTHLLFVAALCAAGNFGVADEIGQFKHQVTGLFSKDREPDLQVAAAKLEKVQLVSIDFANAEATFAYDPAKAFPGAKPEQIVERLDNALKSVSNQTFGIRPLRATPLDKLTKVEIAVGVLDCKACCLAAYEAVLNVPGVEMATASGREARVVAWINPEKTNRTALEEALKQRGVQILEKK